jgi:hypothetical protein
VITRATADPPRLNTPSCGQGPTQSTVSVNATDNVGVTEVSLSWAMGRETGGGPMSADGDTWFGSLGPFSSGGAVTWTVTVVDAAGNPSTRSGTVTVSSCPIIG